MQYKLIAADMDGTLLNSKSEISLRTREAVLAAMEQGVLFVPSTGRPLGGMKKVLAITDADLPLILFNGATAVTARSGKVLFSQGLSFDCAEEIFAEGVRRGYPVITWSDEVLYVSCDCERIQEYHAMTWAELHVVDSLSMLQGENISKMIWLIPPEQGKPLQAELKPKFIDRVNIYTSQFHLLEFVDVNASKGLALAKIGEAYGIDRSEMIAIGDGYNDVPMMEYAGLSVAMGNAPEDIKAICDTVTLSNNEDGAAEIIEKLILSRKDD